MKRSPLSIAILVLLHAAPGLFSSPASEDVHFGQTGILAPDWISSRVLDEINTRQSSEAGSFAAIEADLDSVLVFTNLNPDQRAFAAASPLRSGTYRNAFTGENRHF